MNRKKIIFFFVLSKRSYMVENITDVLTSIIMIIVNFIETSVINEYRDYTVPTTSTNLPNFRKY